MKNKNILLNCSVCFILVFIPVLDLQAQHNHYADKPATHGMLLFGSATIYASHLPMFHSPHNYQIIMELVLDKSAKEKFITDQQLHPEYSTYTLEPEKFVLQEMIDNPKSFKANIYRGHFERGGIKIMANITVSIKQVIYFKKFNAAENKTAITNFILFGHAQEQFAAHQISNKPDFDQILKIKTDAGQFALHEKYINITLNTSENTPVGVSSNEVIAETGNEQIKIILLKQLYLEFGDLKE
jgi:hypothetical protein